MKDYKEEAAIDARISVEAAKDAAQAEINNIRQQSAQAQAQAADKAQTLKEQAAAKAQDLKEQATAKAQELKDQASSLYQKMKDKTADALRAGADKMSDLADRMDN